MNNYYICSTPYHLINSIIIKDSYYKSDYNILILTNNCNCAVELINRVRDEKIFDESILIDDSSLRNDKDKKMAHYCLLAKRYLNTKLINQYICIKLPADRLIVYSFTLFNTLVQSKLIKNGKTRVFVGEDGIRDYIYKDFGIVEPKYFIFFKKIRNFFGVPLITIPSNYIRYIYMPEIRQKLYGDTNSLRILEKGSMEKELKVINKVFNFPLEAVIREKFIYFDSVYDSKLMELQKRIIYEIKDYCGDFILKQHPRNTEKYNNVNKYQYSNLPWEVICMNCDLNRHVLITVNSNACISPKFMLNSEPRIIFLYRLFLKGKALEDTEKLVFILRELYEDKSKIKIPNDIDELKIIIKEFL